MKEIIFSLLSRSLLFLQGTHLFFVQLFFFPPLHCLFPFSAVLSKGFVAAGLQGVPLNLTPAIHLGSAGPADCCDLDTLSEGVLCGWASILPDSPLPCCCCVVISVLCWDSAQHCSAQERHSGENSLLLHEGHEITHHPTHLNGLCFLK